MTTLTLILFVLAVSSGLLSLVFIVFYALYDPFEMSNAGFICFALMCIFGIGTIISAAFTTEKSQEQIKVIEFSSKEYQLEYRITEFQESKDTTYVLICKIK